MRCEEVLRELTAFSSGESPVGVRQAVRAHLAECPKCRAAMARVDALAAVLADVQAAPVPAGFASRVMAVARQRQEALPLVAWKPLRSWWVRSAPMRAAAAAVAFALGVWGAMELSRPALAEVDAGQLQPVADTVLSDCFEAAPGDSLASRYLEAVNSGED